MFPFDEPVLTTYMDLDALIAATPLSKSERHIVGWLMRGHSVEDIADKLGVVRQTISIHLRRAVEKIVDQENKCWGEAHA